MTSGQGEATATIQHRTGGPGPTWGRGADRPCCAVSGGGLRGTAQPCPSANSGRAGRAQLPVTGPHPCLPRQVSDKFAFGLFDLDWDVFSPHIEGAVNRVPVLEKTGVKSTVCGPGE